ncbi:hypothetical protein JANAI61_11780 [Jannaschia sp. AI_61]|nr:MULTISPECIES: hypothetical protein [unclassified Jannaschia]GIT90720.1 hypothetical protein JANAI61_11780 [Jannaschia sp. AI_61]
MKLRIVSSSLFAAILPFAAVADVYSARNTPHFGFVTIEVADAFTVSSMCTVSGGASQERLETLTDFLPGIGTTIMALLNWASLEKGEVFCGLRQYEGPGPFTVPAETKGFELTIRAYSDGEQVGSDLSPRFACRPRGIFNVNRFGFCFEEGGRQELNGEAAEYVVACIETSAPGDGQVVSFLLYAGDGASETIQAMVADGLQMSATSIAHRELIRSFTAPKKRNAESL